MPYLTQASDYDIIDTNGQIGQKFNNRIMLASGGIGRRYGQELEVGQDKKSP